MIAKSISFNNNYDSSPVHSARVSEVLEKIENNGFYELKTSIDIIFEGTLLETINFVIRSNLDQNYKMQYNEGWNFIAYDENTVIYGGMTNSNPGASKSRECNLFICGLTENVLEIYHKFKEYENNKKESYVHWWYEIKNELKNHTFPIKQTKLTKKEFYPWINNLENYINRFDKSEENILIFLGPPGTGKTSLIRHLITRNYASCYTTYDEKVMQNDALYIDFLGNDEVKYIVLEDSDLLLTERARGNHVMSKMLNAADGLVSFTNKKFIFTANFSDKRKIDEALIRPGRCFDVQEFRPLTYNEAYEAAVAAGLVFNNQGKGEYTLAEIFKNCKSVN